LGWYGRTFNESEMARSSECTGSYAQKVLDGNDIVREGFYANNAGDRPVNRSWDACHCDTGDSG